jgi:hypothetical protein
MPDENNFKTDPLNSETPSEAFRQVPNPAERVGTVPHAAEYFGRFPNPADAFRTLPHSTEPLPPSGWRESYTLTVRETARLFEVAGVARSERSIVNWCQRNRQGIARLDAYFDPNERRYFITRQSVDTLIAEEKARAAKNNAEPVTPVAEDFGTPAKAAAEPFRKAPNDSAHSDSKPLPNPDEVAELKKENLDLKITNRGKDYFIEQLQKEREVLLKQVVDSSQRVGQLEARLLQLNHLNKDAD